MSREDLYERLAKLEVFVYDYLKKFMDEERNQLDVLSAKVDKLSDSVIALRSFIRGAVAVLGIAWIGIEAYVRFAL